MHRLMGVQLDTQDNAWSVMRTIPIGRVQVFIRHHSDVAPYGSARWGSAANGVRCRLERLLSACAAVPNVTEHPHN